MVKIAFDAGHGINTPGKRTPDDEREWSFNNKVANAFEKRMKEYENVSLLRTDDKTGKRDVPLRTRTNEANKWKADAYISFHHNAFQSKWGNHGGTETFHHKNSSKGKVLASVVQNAALKAYNLRDRGLKTNNLHITRETSMPAVLVEGGFMDSTVDIKKLRDDKELSNAGKLIADAVAKYFKLTIANTSKDKTESNKPSKPSKPKTKSIDQLANEVINGLHGDGADRKKSLGSKFSEVQKRVNEILLSGNKVTSKPKPGTIKVGSKVKIKSSAGKYSRANVTIPSKHKNKSYTIQQVSKNDVLIKELYSWVKKSDLQ